MKWILDTINKTVPRKLTYIQNFPTWFSFKLLMLIKEKNRVHKLFKTTGLNIYYIEFSTLRK